MRLAIGRRTRAMLVAASVALYVASLSDLSERLEARGLDARAPGTATQAIRRGVAFDPSFVTRDPFDGAPRVAKHGSPAPHAGARRSSDDDAPVDVADAGDPGILVPDIATNAASVAANPPRTGAGAGVASDRPVAVRATIVGAHAAAYVGDGDDLRLVHVGDDLNGRHVARIDVRGIVLSDGTRLDLSERYLATPAPRATPRSRLETVARELARLRSVIERRRPPETAQPRATTAPVRATPEPTAWPLPTADARGLPVGVNPTPDAAGPTAFPYPYPYPPPGVH